MAIDIGSTFNWEQEEPQAPSSVNPAVMAMAKPAAAPVVIDQYTKGILNEGFGTPSLSAPEKKTAQFGSALPYDVSRVWTEGGAEPAPGRGPSVPSVLPGRKDQLAYLTPSIYGGANLTGMADAPLASAYKLRKAANEQGYEVLFTSGARGGGGGSYHDHGEAVDVRIQKRGKSGQLYDLTPQEEVRVGRELGKEAGWASMLDEIRFDPSGRKSGNHLHFSYGQENNLLDDPSHHLLNKRNWTDPNYLKLNPNTKLQEKGSDRSKIPSLIETMAQAHGVDPDIAVRWIQAESNFDPKAKSPAGAFGLAQMMPGTVTEVAKELGVSPDEYYSRPRTQIAFGLHYLKKQLKANNGSYAQAFAAYNAGPGGLDEFKAGKPVYAETRNYVAKILGDIDPDITDENSAAMAIQKGYGRKVDPQKTIENTKAQIENVRAEATGFWKSVFDNAAWTGQAVKDSFGPAALDISNPLSGARQAGYLTNEFFNQATLGLLPLLQSSLDTKQARDNMLSGESGITQLFGTAGVGAAKLGGMIAGGSLLLKGLRMMPAFGALTKGLSQTAANALGKTGNPLIEALQGLDAGLAGAKAGGPLALLFADTTEQMAVGGLQMGSYGFADWLYNESEHSQNPLLDGATTFLTHSMMGGAMALMFGLGVPAAAGLGLNALGQTVGKNAVGGSMAEVLGKYYQGSNMLQRGLMRTGAGAVSGSVLGGVSDITGVSQAVFGEDVFDDAAGIGAMVGLGAPVVAKAVDWSGLTKLVAGSGGYKALKTHVGNMVEKLSEAQVNTLTAQAHDAVQEVFNLTERTNVWRNATVASQQIEKSLGERQQLATKAQTSAMEIEKKIAEIDKTSVSLQSGMKEIESSNHEAKNWMDTRDSMLAEHQQLQQQVQQLQQHQPPMFGQSQLNPVFQTPAYQQAVGNTLSKAVSVPDPSVAAQMQARLVQLQTQEIPRLMEQIKKNPDLQTGVTKIEAARQRLNTAAQQHSAEKNALMAQKESFDVAAAGHTASVEDMTNVLDNIKKVAKSAQSPEDFRTSYGQVKKGPWNAEVDPARKFLDSDKFLEETSLSSMMDSFLERTIFSGRALPIDRLADQAAADAMFLKGGDAYKMNAQKNLVDLQARLGELPKYIEDGAPNKAVLDTEYKGQRQMVANKSEKVTAAEKSLIDWDMDAVKDKQSVLLDAQTVYDGITSTTQVDMNTLEQDAVRKRTALTTSKANKPVAYDKTNPSSLYDLAVEAKAHLDLGEGKMLAHVDDHKQFSKDVMKPAFDARRLNEIKRITEDVDNLDQLINGPLAERKINPLLEEALDAKGKTALTPVDPGQAAEGKWAQGANATEALNFAQMRNNLVQRIDQIERDMKGLPPTVAQSISKVLRTGEFSEAPADVQQWASAGGDMSKAPPKVKEWVDAWTGLHIEEVKRVRWLDENITGVAGEPGAEHLIVSAIREARASGYEEANRPSDVQMLYKLVDERLSQADAADIGAYNTWLSDMMKSDKLNFSNMFGIAQRGWADLVKNRQNTAQIIHEKMIKPTWEKYYQEFEAAQGHVLDDTKKAGFFREFADAIEDSGEMRKFKSKYGSSVDGLMQTHYAVQTMFEMIRANSPELAQWARANYFPHRWRKLAGFNAAAQEQRQAGFTAQMASENRRQFMNLKDADKAREGIRNNLSRKNVTESQFLNTFDGAERAKLMEFGDSPKAEAQWEALPPPQKQDLIKKASERALTLLADDPVLDPTELYQMQLSSIWRADGMRQLLRTWSNTSVAVENAAGVKTTKPLLALSESPGAPGADASVKGPKRFIGSDNYKYQSLGDLPGFANVKMKFNEKEYEASQMYLHPEAFRFFSDFAGGQKTPKGAVGRAWGYITNAVRMNTLLGSFIPHKLQILGWSMQEFWRTPYQVANLMGAGKKVESLGLEGAAALAEATRHGLNVRIMEQGTRAMASSIVQDMGKDFASELYGVEQNGFLRWLQSMDPTDPMQKQAREQLGKLGGLSSDLLGVPTHLDYLVNREALFKPIEYGQLAGYNFRVAQYLKQNSAELSKLAPAERMRQAQMMAADSTNRLSGAFPDAYGNNALRKLVSNTVLTPSWFLSKAYTIVDGIDSMMYLGAKRLSGGRIKQSAMEAVLNRKAFSQYAPEVADAMRSRMGKMIAGGLVGSLAMTTAAQYLIDGTFPWDHPPDKWFHLHHEGTYYTGPIFGYVRDVLRFGSDMTTEDGVLLSKDNLHGRFGSALANAITRQLLPPVEGIGKLLFDPASRGQLSDDTAGAMMSYIQNFVKESSSIPDMVGLDKNNASMADLFNRLTAPLQDKDATAATRANSLRGGQYLLRQLGVYDSKEQTEKNLRGNLYDRQRDIESSARKRLTPFLDKMRSAQMRGDTEQLYQYHKDLQSAWTEGVPVKDVLLKRIHPDGVYRMPQAQLNALLGEALSPRQAAYKGALNSPIGQAMTQTMQAFDNEGSILGDPTDY